LPQRSAWPASACSELPPINTSYLGDAER
jgi:hypothetical protein